MLRMLRNYGPEEREGGVAYHAKGSGLKKIVNYSTIQKDDLDTNKKEL